MESYRVNRIILPFIFIFLTSCQTSQKTKILGLQHITSKDPLTVNPIDLSQMSSEQKDQLGFFLYDPISQKVLEQHHQDRFFIPASTSKVPTTVAALHILGGNYRFHTDLIYTGKIKNNTLYGDLYLKGTGDPLLKVSHLIYFSQALAKKGIKTISGHFYYDDSFLKTEESIEELREPWARYNTGVSALSADFNQFSVRWFPSPNQADGQYQIYSTPDFPFLSFSVYPQELSGETSFLYKNKSPNDSNIENWLLAENLAHEDKATLPLKNPGLATASLFAKLCEIGGLTLPKPAAGITPSSTKLIAQHSSPPLVDIVESVLEYSNNLMAELLQMTAAQYLVKRPVGIAEASDIIRNWMIKKAKTTSYEFKNGSGLSSFNRITPKQLVSILTFADQSDYSDRTYESLLSISGYKGDVGNRLSHPRAALHIRAKTGSMNYTHSLTGFLYTSSGKRLIFAIMNSNLKNRALLDQNVDPISSNQLKKISVWGKNARKLEDDLLMRWISIY